MLQVIQISLPDVTGDTLHKSRYLMLQVIQILLPDVTGDTLHKSCYLMLQVIPYTDVTGDTNVVT